MADWVLRFIQDDSFIILIGSVLFLGVFELFWGLKPQTFKHWRVNMGFGALYSAFSFLIGPYISYVLANIMRLFGEGLIDLSWMSQITGIGADLLIVFVSSFVFDFFFYWVHRLEHHNLFLWQQHIVHHSDRTLAASSGALTSIAEVVLIPVMVGIPMAVLFKIPPAQIAILSALPLTWVFVQHANLKVSFGPFWWLLVSPNFHRIHHSLEKKHFDKNFALWFPILDIIFKTAYKPKPSEIPDTGVEGVEINSVRDAIFFPFKRWLSKNY